MHDARMAAAQATNQVRCRGWDLRPEPKRQPITFIRVLEVLLRPTSLFSLALLAGCVWLLVTQ